MDRTRDFATYNRVFESEIPAGEIVQFGAAGRMRDNYPGGGIQFFLTEDVINKLPGFNGATSWAEITARASQLD